jgi:RNA polymerase sigma factor (sigma-70 family)
MKRGNIGSRREAECLVETSVDIRDRQSLKLTLHALIARLKPELRSVVLFHYYDDLKYDEIAEIIECPIGTVKIRLYRARHELRKLWKLYAV